MAKSKENTKARRSNNSILFWIIGLCSFISFMITGILWIVGFIPGLDMSIFNQVKNVSNLILLIAAFAAGWMWLCSCKMNRKLKLGLKITFCVFAVLAILGIFSIGV